MILDSSAIVAIATEEPGCLELLEKLDRADTVAIGAPTLVEAALVLRSRLTMEPRAFLERFLTDWNVSVVPFGRTTGKRPSMRMRGSVEATTRPRSTSAIACRTRRRNSPICRFCARAGIFRRPLRQGVRVE